MKLLYKTQLIVLFITISCGLVGCVNPFAPELGELSGDIWSEQTTIGGLLRNFQTSYTLRDSLRYSELIADDFEFQYWDGDAEFPRFDQWYRYTELKTTGGLMGSVDHLDLRWGSWPETLDTFSVADTTIEFTVSFSLSAGDFPPLFGFARFHVKAEEDGVFRINMWRDDY